MFSKPLARLALLMVLALQLPSPALAAMPPTDAPNALAPASAGLSSQSNSTVATTSALSEPIASQPARPTEASSLSVDPALRRYPYLTDLVGQFVTINWATLNTGQTGSVTWGQVGVDATCKAHTAPATDVSHVSISVNGVTEYQWKAQLTLSPNTQYCYRVFLGPTDLLGSDPAPAFWTQVPKGSTEGFTFAVIGETGMVDSSGNNPDQAQIIALLAATGARFVLSPGEIAHPSGSQDNFGDLVQKGASLSAFFGPSFWTKAGAGMAFFPEIGNIGMTRQDANNPHLLNFPQDRAVVQSTGSYTATTSGVSAWYAFDAGNARFYLLQAASPITNACNVDCAYQNDYNAHWTPASPEYQWLKKDLEDPNHQAQLKFAVFQFPIYSDNNTQKSDTFLQGAGSLEGLLSSHHVYMAFSAHAQNYQRWLKSSTGGGLYTYVTGGGGATPVPVNACSSLDAFGIGWSDQISLGYGCHTPKPTSRAQVFHILLVHVAGMVVTVTPINEGGLAFDSQTYNFALPDGLLNLGLRLYLPIMRRQ